MSGTPVAFKTAAPSLGQHNAEVYQNLLGLDEQQLAALQAKKII